MIHHRLATGLVRREMSRGPTPMARMYRQLPRLRYCQYTLDFVLPESRLESALLPLPRKDPTCLGRGVCSEAAAAPRERPPQAAKAWGLLESQSHASSSELLSSLTQRVFAPFGGGSCRSDSFRCRQPQSAVDRTESSHVVLFCYRDLPRYHVTATDCAVAELPSHLRQERCGETPRGGSHRRRRYRAFGNRCNRLGFSK